MLSYLTKGHIKTTAKNWYQHILIGAPSSVGPSIITVIQMTHTGQTGQTLLYCVYANLPKRQMDSLL